MMIQEDEGGKGERVPDPLEAKRLAFGKAIS